MCCTGKEIYYVRYCDICDLPVTVSCPVGLLGFSRNFSFLRALAALVALDLLMVEVSRSHSVGLPWTRHRSVAETST